jgi:hypothetical protein
MGNRVEVDAGWLLNARVALAGFQRQGQQSANSTCRLLAGMDGSWLAVAGTVIDGAVVGG